MLYVDINQYLIGIDTALDAGLDNMESAQA